MELDDYVRTWTDQLAAVTALADDRARDVAHALSAASAAAARMVLLEALSAAAAEITEALLDVAGSPAVSVRIEGSQVHLDVTPSPSAPGAAVFVDDGSANARVTVRMTDRLKDDIDAAADHDGVSLNTWIVRALTSALSHGSPAGAPRLGPHRITGWING
jgi:hypothetical protein